jgi:hypothetical protein
VAAPFAQFGMQVRQGLGQRRDVKIPVSLGLGHECGSLKRKHFHGVTGRERGKRSRCVHIQLLLSLLEL